MTLVEHYRSDAKWEGQPKLVTLFSGDAYNPSLESSITKGTKFVRYVDLHQKNGGELVWG